MTVATATTQTLEERVEGWANDLCRALEENFKQETIRSHQRSRDEGDSWSKEYHQDRLDEIALGGGNLYKFAAYKGRKYIKIVMRQFDDMGPQRTNTYKDSSVHAFIDKKTGQVYMPAGYNKPTLTGKYPVRWDLRIIKDREYILNPLNCGWAGGYLYDRSTLPNKYY